MMEKKHNFTPAEKKELLIILKKYIHIIKDRGTDSNTARRKNIAWNRIACEYNTSAIAPHPASSKQLRRLWMNLKQRNKVSVSKLDLCTPSLEEESLNNTSQNNDVEEEISTPFFVSVGSGHQVNSVTSQIVEGNSQVNDNTLTAAYSESRAFDVEFFDEMEDVKFKQPYTSKEVNTVKNSLLVKEYQDRRRRQNELHLLQKQLLMEQIREARAKASLAELELKQQQYLES